MPPKRGDRVSPPPAEGHWELRFADNTAARGWETLASQVPANVRKAWDALSADPRCAENPRRQHRLRHALGQVVVSGKEMEQWQYEVTGGGRIWYGIDDQRRIVWLTAAAPGHPKRTE